MTPPRGLLPSWDDRRFNIPIDVGLFEKLTAEMAGQDETARPADWWMLPQRYLNGAMEGMLDPWCGDIGQVPLADPARVASVSGVPDLLPLVWEFCNQIDHLGLLKGQSLESLGEKNWRVIDLFSVIDALIISAFCEIGDGPRVLEIGGGFGRTAEFLSKSIYPSMRYVNIEAVPISLTYCFQYLKSKFPDKNVSIVTGDSEFDPEADFTILPTWNVHKLRHSGFDLSINIESFQEMSQPIVDFYISMIDKFTHEGGYVYLINSRDYKFKGEFRFPPNWDCLYRQQSPHAWSKNHPTEIYRVTRLGAEARNQIRQVMFNRERALFLKATEARAQTAELAAAEEAVRVESDLRQAAEKKASAEGATRAAAEESARHAVARAEVIERSQRMLRTVLLTLAAAVAGAAAATAWKLW